MDYQNHHFLFHLFVLYDNVHIWDMYIIYNIMKWMNLADEKGSDLKIINFFIFHAVGMST